MVKVEQEEWRWSETRLHRWCKTGEPTHFGTFGCARTERSASGRRSDVPPPSLLTSPQRSKTDPNMIAENLRLTVPSNGLIGGSLKPSERELEQPKWRNLFDQTRETREEVVTSHNFRKVCIQLGLPLSDEDLELISSKYPDGMAFHVFQVWLDWLKYQRQQIVNSSVHVTLRTTEEDEMRSCGQEED
uniref:EF-hand domain-containing protein n=1 Tax=Guillardia theta TaxID=55529 RepID=A0A7S4UCJ1_GUITH